MYVFWDGVVRPALTALQPRVIVEIGSEEGKSTTKLLEFCLQHNAVLHAIDPQPKPGVVAWQQQYAGRFVLHQELSLTALPKIERFDAVLIDGDHNWYTVWNELKIIADRTREAGQPFPLVILHDVSWPYGRRDLYYNPATIPEPHRHPFARRGMRPGVTPLLETGGLNAYLQNAVHEGGPKNGVMTAIEDFLKAATQEIELIVVPGFCGLAILIANELKQLKPDLAAVLDQWRIPPHIASYIEQLEEARIRGRINGEENQIVIRQLAGRLQKLGIR